jgi:hypothetical protein
MRPLRLTPFNALGETMLQSVRLVILASAAIVTAALCASDAVAKAEEIRFKKGAKVTVIKGTWNGSAKTYTFRARTGQYIELAFTEKDFSKLPLTFNLYSYCDKGAGAAGKPELSNGVSYAAMLPCTAQYSFDVGNQDGTDVKKPVKFEIRLSID